MCGIAGCVGHPEALDYVTSSLETLDYRGYDSAGIAYFEGDVIETVKALGQPANLRQHILEDDADITTVIGHTRWATHGQVSKDNTHPHTSESSDIAVVHNGTIENFLELKAELISQGYHFSSQTDTEVIPHLLSKYVGEGLSNEEALSASLDRLVGAYAVLAVFSSEPNSIYAGKVASPLVLGVNGSEHFAASDPSVLQDQTKKAIFLDDHEIARISTDGYSIRDFKRDRSTTRDAEELNAEHEKVELGEYPHYMIKEIHEGPETVRRALSGRVLPNKNMVRLGGLESHSEEIRNIKRLNIVACGTSYHAGLVGEKLIEELAGIPVDVQLASEFQYKQEPFEKDTAILAISQSGETQDTIGAIDKAKKYGMLSLGIVNATGSRIDRITDAGVHCRAGKEVSVASTKAFISQVTVLSEIALRLGDRNSQLHKPIMEEMVKLPEKIEKILEDTSAIEAAAEKFKNYKNFLYMGRGYEHPSALEGALKLKEVSYIHAEGCSAGEMKHGTLALIDEDFPTFAIATQGSQYSKMRSNIEEIRARGGPVIALASESDKDIADHVDHVLYVPDSLEQTQPILNAVSMQLFAYYVGAGKDLNVDKPRNLAKSVTVE